MKPNPQLMTAVEQLGYRVTCGDVATHGGIHLEQARGGLVALASQVGGHLAVTETGEVIYAFPPDFRQVLRRKYVRLQLAEWLNRLWVVIFYGIKISFGILLIASVSIVYLTIFVITIAAMEGGGDCCGSCVIDIFRSGDSSSTDEDRSNPPQGRKKRRKSLNFLEAVFSVLFGDGNPNADLEQRRWSYIGNVIHRQQGAVIGEQIAPYLDDLGRGFDREYENYMLPVLAKFNGIPEVSPIGELVYHFPDLQSTLKDAPGKSQQIPQVLRERKWKFTKATPIQRNWAIALGIANVVGIGILAMMLAGTSHPIIGLILTILAVYGVGLIAIPTGRYFWVRNQDCQIQQRNQYRKQQLKLLKAESVQSKLDYAKQFAKQNQITDREIIYSTESDLLDQNLDRLESLEDPSSIIDANN